MGQCTSIDGTDLSREAVYGSADLCFSAGGAKFVMNGNTTINPNNPCTGGLYCNGSAAPNTAIGGKVCGTGNHEFLCNGSSDGGVWVNSGLPCDENATGSCPTSCGTMTTCDGTVIPKSKIGAKECGDKGLTYVCGVDGKWIVGGKDGKETCVCMTICPDMRGCSGDMVSKTKVGKEVCGFDRKTHICQSNLIGPPDWTYGKACKCPGDPADPAPTVSAPSAPTAPAAAPILSTDSATMIVGVGLFLLFIMIMVVVLMFVMRRKKTGTGEPPAEFSISEALV